MLIYLNKIHHVGNSANIDTDMSLSIITYFMYLNKLRNNTIKTILQRQYKSVIYTYSV